MAKKIGKHKVSKSQFAIYGSKFDADGGNITGDVSIEGDIDILNSISASSGHILAPGDFLFQTQNDEQTTDILSTTGIGSTLGIFNNLLYIDGTNMGVGTVEPSGKLEVAGTVVLSDLPTSEPNVTGSLWLSGSAAGDVKSQHLVVFNP